MSTGEGAGSSPWLGHRPAENRGWGAKISLAEISYGPGGAKARPFLGMVW